MAYTQTTRLGLWLPDGVQEWERSTYNDNWTKLDADMGGATMCTSSTRPTTENYPGRLCFESDTGHLIIRNSTNTGWNLGIQVLSVTSFTRPTVTIPGMLIYETDTQSLVMRNSANSGWVVILTGQTFYNTSNTTVTTNSTSFGNGTGGTTPGIGFVAPPSGEVFLHYSCSFVPGAATTQATQWFAPHVKTGSSVDAGSDVVVASEDDAVRFSSGGTVIDVRFGAHRVVPSLTPGQTYNVKMKLKHAGTAGTIKQMKVIVQPM